MTLKTKIFVWYDAQDADPARVKGKGKYDAQHQASFGTWLGATFRTTDEDQKFMVGIAVVNGLAAV